MDELLRQCVAGFRNGLVFGTRIRLPHALVMTLLFAPPSQSLQQSLAIVLKLTAEHAFRLGSFVAIFKAFRYALMRAVRLGDVRAASIAGLVSALLVFGRETSVTTQVIHYLTSRILFASWKLNVKREHSWRVFAMQSAMMWSLVMGFWQYNPELFPPSVRFMMHYLHSQSDRLAD